MPFAVWITGLPGSGKSTIADELKKKIKGIEHMRLDELRKKYIRDPKFTDEERETVYSKFIDDGVTRVKEGRSVIFDATAHRLKWRDEARSRIGNFIEVYVRCPIERCIERETSRPGGLVMANLYAKAIERKRTGEQIEGLGKVVGVDVPYEVNKKAEIVIDSAGLKPEEAAGRILEKIKTRGWM